MIGIDIIEISRIEKALSQRVGSHHDGSSNHFMERVFSVDEINWQRNNKPKTAAQHFAGLFCAKEAAVKAMGKSIFDYEIVHESSGKPIIINRKNKEKLNCELSISHCKAYATAIVVAANSK